MAKVLTADFMKEVAAKLKVNKDKVSIENKVFRIFSKVTVAIMFLSCGLVTLQDLIGENIKCLTPPKEDLGDNKKAVVTYCFIMSTYTLPHLFNKTIGIHTPHFGVGPYIPENEEHETRYHNYYQWVPFVLFFQGLFFLLPHYLWKAVEGNKIKTYCNLEIADKIKLKHRVLLKDGETDKKDKQLTMAAEYYIKHRGYNNYYAYTYIFCELLNFIIVVLNIYIVDAFLGHQFSHYGLNVVKFLSKDPEDRTDPLNEVFPKVTKCDFHKYGPGGNLINYDIMCILPLNILNEKIYTFLWFWYIIAAIIGGLGLIYRILVLFIPGIRTRVIMSRALADDKSALYFIAEHISYPDWFILKRLADNFNRLRFGEFCHSVQHAWVQERNQQLPNGAHTHQSSPNDSLAGSPPPMYQDDDDSLKGMHRKISKEEQEHEEEPLMTGNGTLARL